MNVDPYEVLGVPHDASEKEIRKAYRALAKKLHPDLHPGDPKAVEQFKKVSAAYHILKDPQRRSRHDRGERPAEAHAQASEHPFYRDFAGGRGAHAYSTRAGFADFENAGDIFADIFRAGRSRGPWPGADVSYRLDLDLEDAARGGVKRITLADGGTLDVRIPEGVTDGQTLRLRGKGLPGRDGGPPGDALVAIMVRPHARFRRHGVDILLDLPISLPEAILGARVEAPTLWGPVVLNVPPGSSSGRILRLRGKGVRRRGGGEGRGDQLVTLQVVLPKTIDEDLKAFMKGWGEHHPYDPRKAREQAS